MGGLPRDPHPTPGAGVQQVPRMLIQGSGPHIVEHLRGRVESLTNALERAQERIDALERVFGAADDLLPLVALGLTPTQARIVHVLRTRDLVPREQLLFAMYAHDPDQINEVDSPTTAHTQVHFARRALARFGVAFQTIGRGQASEGYRMSGPDKARLARLIASGARLVTRGRADRKYYRRAAE